MSVPDVVIRRRGPADLTACTALLLAVHASDGYPVNLPAVPAAFLDLPGLLGAWVATRARPRAGIVGHVVLRARTVDPVMTVAGAATCLVTDRLAVVARLVVAPDARGLGIGRALLDAAVAEAHALGRRPVLDVVKGSDAAISLYERAGWQLCGETRVTYATGTFDELVYVGPPDHGALEACQSAS